MRQLVPISPAIHLGAERVLVIGAGRLTEPVRDTSQFAQYPSLAQIAGHALSSIFLDSLAVDIECMSRVNLTLSLLTEQQKASTPFSTDRNAHHRAIRAFGRDRKPSCP